MSISRIRKTFENKGCQVVLWVIGLLTCVGLLYTGTCAGMSPWSREHQPSGEQTPIAEVSGITVTVGDFDAIQQLVQQNRQQQQPQASSDPAQEFQDAGRALSQVVTDAAIQALAKKKGVEITDDVVTEVMGKQLDSSIQSIRAQLVQQKKLKADASQADFVAAFKKENGGKTPDEIKAQQIENVKQARKDPEQQKGVDSDIRRLAVEMRYVALAQATDDEVKKSYDTFDVKRISFGKPGQDPAEVKKEAEKALAEIKGGLKFDDAIAKYAKGTPTTPMPYPRSFVEGQDSLKFLLSMKAGDVSDVIESNGTTAIFQLVDIKSNVPADFDKNKATYEEQFKTQKGQGEMQKDIQAIFDNNLKWKDDQFKYAFDVYELLTKGPKPGSDFPTQAKELADLGAKLKAKDNSGRLTSLAQYNAFAAYYQSLSPAQQKTAKAEWADMMKEVLDTIESPSVRLQLYDAYVDLGKYEDAGDELLEVAKNNAGTDPASISIHGEIKRRHDDAVKAGKIDKEVLADVQTELDRWDKDRIEDERQKAAEDKANNANSAKVDEELKKLDEPKSGAKSGSSDVDKELDKLDDPDAVKKSGAGDTKEAPQGADTKK